MVDVTSSTGGIKEERETNRFEAELNIEEDGVYSLLLDVGQSMARRHNLSINGVEVIEMQKLWLPPTTSTTVTLHEGKHTIESLLQSTAEIEGSTLTLHIYPGNDGAYTLYQDNGADYGYEKGEYAKIHFTWNDQAKELTIEKAEGNYPINQLELMIKLMGQEAKEKKVTYTNRNRKVKF